MNPELENYRLATIFLKATIEYKSALSQSKVDINYTGAYGDTDFDEFGDVEGKLVYSVFTWHGDIADFSQDSQVVLGGKE